MGNIKVKIKNWTNYFFDDMITIKDFDSNLLKIDENSYKNSDVYYDFVKVNSVHTLYLITNNVDGYIKCSSIKEKK